MSTPTFLSAASANALISDLRPTTLSSHALHHINGLIDEVLSLLITHAQSINPIHLRVQGIPAVFSGDKTVGETTGPKALGRSAVAEAELELRSWYESHPSGKRAAFQPDGQGTGVRGSRPSFPTAQASELLKLKCVEFSTLAPTDPPSDAYAQKVLGDWKAVGGDASDDTLSPAGLWMTAILEHVCEHVLGQLARVVARDSSIAVAGVQDLYVALCEDESIWGLFRRLEVKPSLEGAIRASTRQRRAGTPIRHSPSHSLSTANGSKSSLPPSTSANDNTLEQARLAASTPVEHIPEKFRGSASSRKISSGPAGGSHQRSASLLSANTKSIVSAFNEQYDSQHQRKSSQDEEEFDALVRSGETMKVSLTPSRLKTFESSPNKRSPASPSNTQYVRTLRPTQSPEVPELSPLTPANAHAQASNDASRKSPMRPFSAQRLVARNAATIKEDEDEDDKDDEELFDGRKPKKESLADIFAAESKNHSRKSSASSGKRTVPAVVLGSPPPRDTSLPDGSPSRRAKRHDLTVDVGENEPDRARKPRSEAQELADFFNPTQPPPSSSHTFNSESRPEEPPKSAKSFKSFMSRMTGKKREGAASAAATGGGRDADRPAMPTSFSANGLAGLVKRQKSTTSFSSSALPTPTAEKRQQYPEALSAARQPTSEPVTADSMHAIGVAAVGMGSGVATDLVSTERRMKELRVNTTPQQRDVASENTKMPEPSRPADSPTIGQDLDKTPQPRPPTLAPPITTGASNDEYVVVDKADATPSLLDTEQTEPSTAPSPTKPTPSTATHSQFPSDAASFKTANDDSRSPSADIESESKHTRDVSTSTVPAPVEAPVAPQAESAVTAQPPSIPLSDLAPLRGLLQHATTARECQLLLGAILTQLGVPLSSGEVVDPESRVAAWLLAGRDGPVDYTSASGTVTTATTTVADDSIATPTINNVELLQSEDQAQNQDQGREQETEVVVEDEEESRRNSDTTSMARTSFSAIDSVPEVKHAQAGKWAEAVHVPVSPDPAKA